MDSMLTPYDKNALDLLEDNLYKMSPNNQKFAKSLLASFSKYHNLTPKQMFWVKKLGSQAAGVPMPVVEPSAKVVGNFSGVYNLFYKAKENLKYPKINLVLQGGKTLELHLSGPKSKLPGVVNITDGGKYPHAKWYGRISKDGVWTVPKDGSVEQDETLYATIGVTLKKLADDPIGTAHAHGQLSGNCCFCNKKLTDPQSTAAGFGYTCAKNFGLEEKYKKHMLVDKADKILADMGGGLLSPAQVNSFVDLLGIGAAKVKKVTGLPPPHPLFPKKMELTDEQKEFLMGEASKDEAKKIGGVTITKKSRVELVDEDSDYLY